MVKWFKRLGVALAVLAASWVVAWAALPPLVKWQAPGRLAALLGRPVTLGDVAFHPWALEMTLDDLQIGAAPGAAGAPLLKVAHVRANVALSSIVRGAPIIEAIDVDGLRVQVARLSDGRYDIDDLLRRFAAKPDAKPSEPTRFALYNLRVRDAQLRFDDRPVGRVQAVDALNLSLPFLSNLPANVAVTVQPHLAFRLNGASFDSAAQATPFAPDDHGTLKLALADLDVRPYLGYLPDSLPLRVAGGALSADVALEFTQPAHGAPGVSLKGWVAARDLALIDVAGTPLLAWKQLRVALGDVQPLARKLAIDSVRLEGLQAHVDRDKAGDIDLLHQGAAAPRAGSGKSAPPASAGSAASAVAAPGWQVSVGAIDVVDGRVLWNDASVKPAAALALDKLALSTKRVAWPGATPTPFTFSADLGTQGGTTAPAHLSASGTAGMQDAKVDVTLDDLALSTLAPYLAQALVPRVDGTLAAQATLDWSAAPGTPRLQVVLAKATLDGLRVQPPGAHGTPPAALERLALSDVQVDVSGRSATLGEVRLVHPSLSLARDAQGRLDAAGWVRAASASPAPSSSKPASSAPETPWHVQVRQAAIADGQVQVADASLRRDPAAAPWRAELRQLQLTVQDFAWFGDRPVPPAKVQLSARVGGPRDAGAAHPHAGELGWKGDVGIGPLAAAGTLRVVRFPVALVTPYLADRLPVSLLRAEAGYVGHLALKAAPAGLSVNAGGDVLIGDVHLTTLPSATASAPDELLAWRALSLKGVKFALAPQAAPRLDIGQIELDDLYARLVVTEQGHLNLQDVGAPSSSASAAAAASSPDFAPAAAQVAVKVATKDAASEPATAAPAIAQPPAMVVNIGPTRLVNARIDYTDHFVRPNYSAALTELNGTLGAFGSASRDMAALQLNGRAEGTAILDIAGRVNPLATPLALDIRAKATDLELAPLSPYAGKYAGYAIERGKLSMDLAYRIAADGRLEASNRVVLNQLTFGDAIDSPSATKLPVRLAIALLKDRNGVIDIDLPVSGSVNDPQFSVGGIVVKLIVNLLVKAVTSPFSLLSGGGGGGPDLSAIEFRPGSAVMRESGNAAIAKVAAALIDRPALQLTITGSADPAHERADFQREAVDAQLLAAAHDDDTHAPRTTLLKALYKKTALPDKPHLLGFAKDIPDAEMEGLLRRNVTVGAEAMHQLALARAIAVRDALVAQGVSIDRLFLAAPGTHDDAAGDAGWTPRAALALATK